MKSVLIVLFALSSSVFAQDKLLTLDDIFSPDSSKRVAFGGRPANVSWASDGKSFKETRNGRLMRVDALTGTAVAYYDSEKLASALQTVTGEPLNDVQRLANSTSLNFNKGETAILVNFKDEIWLWDVGSAALKRLTNNKAEEQEEEFSPDGKYISFVRGNNLFVLDIATGTEKQLTSDGSEKIYNGYLDWVYEEELYGRGQKKAYWWSPDSKYIAFLRLDESPVPKFVLANDIPNDQVIENTDYPQAGDGNPLVQLGVVSVGGGVKFADLSKYDPKDLLIVRVAWSPKNEVVFQAQNREQSRLDVNSARPDGAVRTLFNESSLAWVGINGDPIYLKDGSFLWQSERDGWNHFYHYSADGRLIKRVTSGKWEVRSVHGVDEANGWIYFSGTKDSHIAENVYRARLSDGTVERLTKGDGWHSASFNSSFSFFVENWSDINTPTQTRLFNSNSGPIRVINENKVDALKQYKLGQVEFMKVKTRDGFEMEAMMIKPPNFDPNKKYPVLQYAYAGPHSQTTVNRWGGTRQMWHQMLAQKGYIIWVCDNRTASGKGLESTWQVYKRMGETELKDIEDGLNYLKSLPYVDGERLGIWGWSYGGFMTSYSLTHSTMFKAGISGGTVSDWRLYDSIYTERYMQTPQNNKDGYDHTSVSKAAKDLHGNLLLIHGVMDDNVHMQNTIQFANELQKYNKQFQLMVYPTQRHGISNPLQVRHMYELMTNFILKNL
ncbi:MAG: S9 family peptidase [Pyrinomonadaceae bacterium]